MHEALDGYMILNIIVDQVQKKDPKFVQRLGKTIFRPRYTHISPHNINTAELSHSHFRAVALSHHREKQDCTRMRGSQNPPY